MRSKRQIDDGVTSESSLTGKRRGVPVALIRLSAVLFGGLMIGHMSAYPWTSSHLARQVNLVEQMRNIPFEFMGERSTYWNLYFGWGLLVGVLLFTLTITLWLLARLVYFDARGVGAISGTFSAASAVGAYLSIHYFYVPPFLFFLVIAALLATAAVQLLRRPERTIGSSQCLT
jgi:hypothetical protein